MENKDYYEQYYSIKEEILKLYKVKVPNKYENFEEFLKKEGITSVFENSEFVEAENIAKSDPFVYDDINRSKISK